MLKEYLTEITSLSPSEISFILEHFSERSVKKNEILIRNDEVCKQLFFIKKGLLRVYCLRHDGLEWTRFIAFENEFATIVPSFIHQTPSKAFLQALEPTELLAISYHDFYRLLDQFPEWDRFYRLSLEKAYVDSIDRIEQFITMSAKELYANCMQNKPELIQRLPNKILASYFGISAETLSRLKSRD